MINPGWTEERVAELKRLCIEGKSFSQIAKTLGGISRNSAIGKAHRLGIVGPGAAIRQQASAPKARTPTPKRPKPKTSRPIKDVATPGIIRPPVFFADDPASANGVSLIDLTVQMCRWPIGDPGRPGFHFCAEGRATAGPYCARHAAKASAGKVTARDLIRSVGGRR